MTINRVFQIVGAILLVAGIAGLVIPGNNTLGFPTNTLHDFIHIGTGVIWLFAGSQRGATFRNIALVFGVVYGLVTLMGFLAPSTTGALMADDPNATLATMMPDNLLHILLTALALYAGLSGRRETAMG
jgi:hypothetical protein